MAEAKIYNAINFILSFSKSTKDSGYLYLKLQNALETCNILTFYELLKLFISKLKILHIICYTEEFKTDMSL